MPVNNGSLTVESLQDRYKSNSATMGESFGGGGGSANVGVNFNLEKSSSKWVNEQTSLTAGGTVNIDVADKTTLKGAVIASDTGDLTLATGSFEYSNIKDSDRSYNVGGGANIGGGKTDKGTETNYSVNGNYGFTDSRQTNFATVGEGTIIVRDGTSIGTPGTYDGLKRDVTLAQYNTKEGGLQGGFTVDDTTVDFVSHPIDTTGLAAADILFGINDAANTTVDIYNEAGEVVEKTGNWIESDHFTTDDKVRYYRTMDEYKALKASGGEITPLDTLLYYKSKVAAGEELTQEEIAEYANVSVIVRDEALKNSRVTEYVPDKFNQSVIDRHVGVKTGCNFTSDVNIIVNKAIKDGLTLNPEILTPTGEVDMIKVYDLAKKHGDKVVSGNLNMVDEIALARIIAPDSNYEIVNGGAVTKDNIKEQLDNDQKIKIKLSDGHRETIYDYDTDEKGNVTRYKLDDGGYQGDTYVDPESLKAYKVKEGNEDIEENRKYSRAHGEKGTTRDVSKIYIIKDKTE